MYGLCLECNIAEMCDLTGITKNDLLGKINRSKQVSMMDNNQLWLDVYQLPLIADYFKVSIDQLFSRRSCDKLREKRSDGNASNCPYFKEKCSFLYEKIKESRLYDGENVYCPCCDKKFSHFKKFEIKANEQHGKYFENTNLDVVCPYCSSLPRHRMVCEILSKEQFLTTNVLLFAPNNGLQLWFKRNKIGFMSADLNDNSNNMRIDIQKTSFNDNEFDFISCDHVLEHVQFFDLAVNELYRITKKGGCVEITVPILPLLDTTYEDVSVMSTFERMEKFGQYDHLRMFGRDFTEKLKKVGFDVRVFDGDFFDPTMLPLTAPAIYDSNKVFFCTK